jgi:predicted metal-dependent phosphoesterase TrpH
MWSDCVWIPRPRPCATAWNRSGSGRLARAQRISAALDKLGFPATFDAALALAKSERLLSRTHFARHLVERGAARDIQQAFDSTSRKASPGMCRTAGRISTTRWAGSRAAAARRCWRTRGATTEADDAP